MTIRTRRRGAPLAAMGLIVGGWVVARILFLGGGDILPRGIAGPLDPNAKAGSEMLAARPAQTALLFSVRRSWPLMPGASPARTVVASGATTGRRWLAPPPVAPVAPAASPRPAGRLAKLADAASFLPPPPPPAAARFAVDKRWSSDAWLLLRPDGGRTGGLLARYGASQAGAVLRYRLVPDSGHRPAAYLRVAVALDRPRQKEGALGLSARPLPGLPVVAAAELRVTSDRFGTRTRPAALVYTELPPFDFAPGLRGEGYLQGGYVGGRAATAFVDGQVRVDHALVDLGRAQLRVGAGAWGGAQEGAERLDVGPMAQLAFPLAEDVFGRLAFDWRFRVAGDAAPASGPALTLSAGF